MTADSTSEKQFRFTGWHMAGCMGVFFGIVIAVNVYMAYRASNSWTGLVVKNSYVASQQFNRDLEASRQQTRAGWYSDLVYQNGEFSIVFKTRENGPLFPDNVVIAYGRPAFEQQDNKIALHRVGGGKYAAPLNLQPGQWFVKITATIDGQAYRRDARMTVDDKRTGELQ